MPPHHEDPGGALGQRTQACLQRGEELLLPQGSLGLLPCVGRLFPMAAPVEQAIQFAIASAGLLVRRLAVPALAPDRIHDFVFQDAGEPGAQVGAPREVGFPGERRQQGLLNRVFRGGGIPQLQRGIAQQVGPQALDLGAEVGGLGGGRQREA